jgi:hypothetical protein
MQENRHNRRLSCKIDYSLRSNRPDQSIASEFFTDDEIAEAFGSVQARPTRGHQGSMH